MPTWDYHSTFNLGHQHNHNLSLCQPVQPRKHFLVQGRRRCWQQLVTRIRIRRAWGWRDSRETGSRSRRQWFFGGLHALAFDCRRHRIWTGIFSTRATERPLPQEIDPDILSLPQQWGNVRCSGATLQQYAQFEEIDPERGLCCGSRQCGVDADRMWPTSHPQPNFCTDKSTCKGILILFFFST